MILGLMILMGFMGNGEGTAIGLIRRLDFGTSFISGKCSCNVATGFSAGLPAAVFTGCKVSATGAYP